MPTDLHVLIRFAGTRGPTQSETLWDVLSPTGTVLSRAPFDEAVALARRLAREQKIDISIRTDPQRSATVFEPFDPLLRPD
jgi:hypothetical protein